MTDEKTITAQVVALQKMNTDELKKLWRKLNGKTAPDHDIRVLRQRLAVRIQELALGGLSETSRHSLRQASKHSEHKPRRRHNRLVMPPIGTIITKEYNGETHQVTVTHRGFEYRGDIYKSLSSVAYSITGTNWSGPVFFKLNGGTHGKDCQ